MCDVHFEIVGAIGQVKRIAAGKSIGTLARLDRRYGPGRWRKCKGIAQVRLADGSLKLAELHWYEAAGIGRRDLKLKRFIDAP